MSKLQDKDIIKAFYSGHRAEIGKIELSASEVTNILNNRVLPGDKSVTRQAVSKRLNQLVESGTLTKNEHGRSHLYMRADDIQNVFSKNASQDIDVVETLRSYKRPFMGTRELADELGYSTNPGVKPHLESAVESGDINKANISGYNIWYLPEIENAQQS